MKKLIATILSLVLIIAVCPTGLFSFTAGAETSGIYTYSVSNGEATITNCDKSASGAIEIPAILGGCPVTSIGFGAFYDCTGLTSITIGNSVTSIGEYAFYDCTGLTGITIPNSITSIGDSAFSGCTGLTSITIPNSVTSIGEDAFKSTGLTSITFLSYDGVIVFNRNNRSFHVSTVNFWGTEDEWHWVQSSRASGSVRFSADNWIYHHGEWSVITPATCTENGLERRVCEECGETLERTIPAHHTEQVLRTVAPTCTERGYDLVKCTVCGTRYTTHYTAALGHTFGNWQTTTAPTCTQAGEQKRVCTVCNKAEERKTIAATGHTYDWEVIVPATCTQTGERRRVCTVCGEHGETETAPALGHDYRLTETVAATCVNDGFYLYTCARCGGTRRDVIPAAGHYFIDGECVDCGIREADAPYDLNGDGVLNALDLVAMKKRLIGGTTEETPDINGDGAVNVLDAIALKKRLSSRS